MSKILIIGSVASGKTTLAKRLSQNIQLPWYELDSIVYDKTSQGRYKRSAEEQVAIINEMDKKGVWIFEGTDRDSYQCLYQMSDIIIFLDPPLWKRRVRIFTRFLKQRCSIEKSHYKPDIIMLKMMYKWTRDFENNRNDFESKLKLFEKKVMRLRDNNNLDFSKGI